MQDNPNNTYLNSSEADSASASQEIPHILQHLNVHCFVHNSMPLAATLSQLMPYPPQPILKSRYQPLGLSGGLFLTGVPTKPFMHLSSFPYIPQALPIFFPSLDHHPNDIL
jgi:hypothetical protein